MRIDSVIIFAAALVLFSGCVSIPDGHFTVEQDGYTCNVDTEILCEHIELPDNYLGGSTRGDGLDPKLITLLNWNSHKGTGPEWQQELQHLIKGADLITLQEGALTWELREELSGHQIGGWTLANAFTQSDIHTGVLTASMVKPDFFCSFRIAEPIIIVPKTVLITRYPIIGTKQSLLLVNLHLVNFSFATRSYREQLSKAFDLIKQHEGPLLIAGDFNSWNDERQSIVLQFADALGADSVHFFEDYRITFFNHVLDYIFYRGLAPVEAVVEQVTTSDHNPMRVSFRLADEYFAWSTSDE